jgi:hypothetical protein
MRQNKDKNTKPKEKNKAASEAIKKEQPYVRKWGNQFSKKYTDEEIEKLADEMHEWFIKAKENGKGQVWLKDFAAAKMMSAQRISEFAKHNKYFSYILEICKDIQEAIIFKIGLTTKSNMPIFALKNVAGWKDKTEVEHSGGVKVIRDTIKEKLKQKENG